MTPGDIASGDQNTAAWLDIMETEAKMLARYYKTLVAEGLPEMLAAGLVSNRQLETLLRGRIRPT